MLFVRRQEAGSRHGPIPHDCSNPDHAIKMSSKSTLAWETLVKYVWLGVLYCILVIVMGFHGYAASLEFLTYPVLLKKFTCIKKWDFISQSIIPAVPLFANTFGSIVGGIAVDKIGRRPVLIVGCFLVVLSEIVNLMSMNAILYVVTRTLTSLIMGIIYLVSALFVTESVPLAHRLNALLVYFLIRQFSYALYPLIVDKSPFDADTYSWKTVTTVTIVIAICGIVIGFVFPEPAQSEMIRREACPTKNNMCMKYKLINLDKAELAGIKSEHTFGSYLDMFYSGGKVAASLLLVIYFVSGLLNSALYFSMPIAAEISACGEDLKMAKPCNEENVDIPDSKMLGVMIGSFIGVIMAYICAQRYGRKNTMRGPAAFRVIVTISLVLCVAQKFMLAQLGLIMVLTAMMEFTAEIYAIELYAIRSRGTAFGLLLGLRTFGIACYMLLSPLVSNFLSVDLKMALLTILGTLVFGCSLGLRKDTFFMSLNIEDAIVDVGL